MLTELMPSLTALIAEQGGVFTAGQARASGHTNSEIQSLRARGHLMSLRRGVYAWRQQYLESPPPRQHSMRVAALYLSLSTRAVLSHQSAAAELGIELLDPDFDLLHVTRDFGAGARTEAAVKHHVAELPEDHVVRRVNSFDLTSPARTAVDVARDSDRFESAVAVFDSALRMGIPRAEIREVVMKCRSWPGIQMVGSALAIADGRAANPGESWSRVVLIQQGVPPDELQRPVYDDEGLIGYADFAWEGVLGEFDGKLKYGIGTANDQEEAAEIVWREKRREDRLRVEHEVVRWGVADLYRPTRLGGRVRAAMARAATRKGRAS